MAQRLRRLIVLLIITLGRPLWACQVLSSTPLEGAWLYYQFLYQGRSYPPNDPDLIMTLKFNSSQESWLKWTYSKSSELCERKAVYQVDNCLLTSQVVWVNPDNAPGCGRDPDMQLGRSTSDRLDLTNNDLHLHLTLGGEPLVLIWKKID